MSPCEGQLFVGQSAVLSARSQNAAAADPRRMAALNSACRATCELRPDTCWLQRTRSAKITAERLLDWDTGG